MTKDEQVLKLLKLAEAVNSMVKEEGLLEDTLGVCGSLRFHLDDRTFNALARFSKIEVKTFYIHGSLHAEIMTGAVEFTMCHNLI